MFSDEDKEIPENNFMQPGDEIISIREVCLSDKFDKKDLGFRGEPLLSSSGRNDLDVPRSLFREGFFSEGLEQQARFAWTEEDGNIASLVSEPGFGTTGQTTFGKDLDAALKSEMKEADTSSAVFQPTTTRNGLTFTRKPYVEPHLVSSTSTSNPPGKSVACKVDKADPRSRFHYVKYVKRHGRTIKLWECGICSREFQHQYTLMRHLPTHTDERNFHCEACGKSFRQLSTLSQHRAIHSAERPYACEVCNKTFNRVSTLISHRKTHSDEKPYRCHLCPKGFHQKGNLRNHLFTHTNERPYRCNVCYKGFNQQSNLVCHKIKAHPDDGSNPLKSRSSSRISRSSNEAQPDSTRQKPLDHCEVSSSVEPFLPMNGQTSSDWQIKSEDSWDASTAYSDSVDVSGNEGLGTGVIVDTIKTYHMEVALAKKQTPFALLKPDNGSPVLVKVVDTAIPAGKQMLVPATAEDLRDGGKIILNKENEASAENINESSFTNLGAAQIRVPVVATVIPKIRPGGRLQLIVEEPHHAYHTALSSDVIGMDVCSSSEKLSPPALTPRPESTRIVQCNTYIDDSTRTGGRISSTCALPPPAPSPPLDLIPMDLFEPMECIPMGPQITAVDNISQPPPSDDSDIFIGEFEESIPLSDSD